MSDTLSSTLSWKLNVFYDFDGRSVRDCTRSSPKRLLPYLILILERTLGAQVDRRFFYYSYVFYYVCGYWLSSIEILFNIWNGLLLLVGLEFYDWLIYDSSSDAWKDELKLFDEYTEKLSSLSKELSALFLQALGSRNPEVFF